MHRGIPAVLARGGASRGLIVRRDDLHAVAEDDWPSLFAYWLGSPDPSGRQIDGAGGGNPSTSKVVVLGESGTAGRDLDYAFFQIDAVTGAVECRGTCGNLTAAAGLVAVQDGLVPAQAPETVVRLHDTNTGQPIDVVVPLDAVRTVSRAFGERASGEAEITTRFAAPAGATTGRLLPAGELRREITVDGVPLTVTLVDAVNPVVLVDGAAIGLGTDRSPADLEADPKLTGLLEEVRAWAAVACGFAPSIDEVPRRSPFYPFVGAVLDPQDHRVSGGETIRAGDVDAVVRMMSGGTVHRALPLSAGLAAACAVYLGGAGDERDAEIRLGHPSGVLRARLTGGRDPATIDSISVGGTARVIMSGFAALD